MTREGRSPGDRGPREHSPGRLCLLCFKPPSAVAEIYSQQATPGCQQAPRGPRQLQFGPDLHPCAGSAQGGGAGNKGTGSGLGGAEGEEASVLQEGGGGDCIPGPPGKGHPTDPCVLPLGTEGRGQGTTKRPLPPFTSSESPGGQGATSPGHAWSPGSGMPACLPGAGLRSSAHAELGWELRWW